MKKGIRIKKENPQDFKKWRLLGVWVAQLVKHPTFDLSSGLDLRVMSSSLALGLFKKKKSEDWEGIMFASWSFQYGIWVSWR